MNMFKFIISCMIIFLPSCLSLTPVKIDTKPDSVTTNLPSQNQEQKSQVDIHPEQNSNTVLPEALNNTNIEKLIWKKTNQERQKAGLKILEYEDKVAEIARAHSKNMAENNFFDHTDPNGLSPSERITKGFSELFTAGSAENIAYNFGNTDEEAATNLVTAWMNSPGHRANILNSGLTYIGVGAYIKGERIYATQNFIKPVAVPVSDLTKSVNYGDTLHLAFKFYPGVIDKNDLTVFVKFPDPTSKFYLPNNSFYTGEGKYIPQWEDNKFIFSLTFDRGKGDYLIQICENNNCYDSKFKINVK